MIALPQKHFHVASSCIVSLAKSRRSGRSVVAELGEYEDRHGLAAVENVEHFGVGFGSYDDTSAAFPMLCEPFFRVIESC